MICSVVLVMWSCGPNCTSRMKEDEIRKAAEERRRDKLEDKIARQKVKEQIEMDRQARKETFSNKPAAESKPPQATPQTSATAQPAQKKEYTTARLQVRTFVIMRVNHLHCSYQLLRSNEGPLGSLVLLSVDGMSGHSMDREVILSLDPLHLAQCQNYLFS